MEYKLWENGTALYNHEYGQPETTVVSYLCDNGKSNNGCVIICPGGGYHHRAYHEGEPIAHLLNKAGISAFVLNYRVAPYKHPAPLYDAQRAIRFVRYNAEKFNIDPNKIGILGFSAGGHLTSTACTLYDYGKQDGDEIDKVSCRPDVGILCYAVISFLNYMHTGSRNNLIGQEENVALDNLLSGEMNVRSDCPPMFLWHTFADASVPVENTINMSLALCKKKIPHEMHIFPTGGHGMGLAHDKDAHAAQWSELMINWLKLNNF